MFWGRVRGVITLTVATLLALPVGSASGLAQNVATTAGQGPTTQRSVHHDTSPPLRILKPIPHSDGPISLARPAKPPDGAPTNMSGAQASSLGAPSTIATFEGIAKGGGIPPDPSGAAGPNQYVAIVNFEFAVYSKTGTPLSGPMSTKTLWQGFGGLCETSAPADPTVEFDQLAERWVIQRMARSFDNEVSDLLCVAVSSSSDATDTWYRYSFKYTNYPDYTKLAVWPDAYYASSYVGTKKGITGGPELCAFDRAAMLTGSSASKQCFREANQQGAILPATLHGTTPPAAGEPAWFLERSKTQKNALAYRTFHVDWEEPENTTLSGPTNLSVEAYTYPTEEVPQPDTTRTLGTNAVNLMQPLGYRNFGDHQAIVATHAVDTGESIGMRWYELRPEEGALSLYQQGTYSPDDTYRWTGSIAIDRFSNIALGYSVSSSSVYPGIRYTGRFVDDPLGTMPWQETSLQEGGGSQTNSGRWGDYTHMSVDPADDCTFWYVNQYAPDTYEIIDWYTRIGSFRSPACNTVNLGAATEVSSKGVTLNATVNPDGRETGYQFEYIDHADFVKNGYENAVAVPTTPKNIGSGTEDVAVDETIDDLEPGRKYHFLVKAVNGAGTIYSQDGTIYTPTYQFDFEFGEEGSGEGEFGDPEGADVDSEGNLYVADSDNNRVQVFDSEGDFLFQFGETGSGEGQFDHPYGVAVDAQDDLYVVDNHNHRVQKFDSEGNFLIEFGQEGSGEGQFRRPYGVDTDSKGNVYVGDFELDRVQKFDSEGNFLLELGETGSGEGQFDTPFGIAVGRYGTSFGGLPAVFVADWGNHRVQVFLDLEGEYDGHYLGQIGEEGSGPGQFTKPGEVATDSEGDVYVADQTNRVQRFAAGIELIETISMVSSNPPMAIGALEDTLWTIPGSYIERWTARPLPGPLFEAAEFPGQFTVAGPAASFKSEDLTVTCAGGGETDGDGELVNEARGEITLAFDECTGPFTIPVTSPGQPEGTIVTSALKAEPVFLDASQSEIGLLLTPPKSGRLAEFNLSGFADYVVTGSIIVSLTGVGLEEEFSEFTFTTEAPKQVEEAGPEHGLEVAINGGAPQGMALGNESSVSLENGEVAFVPVE